jgi:hypothetical protein
MKLSDIKRPSRIKKIDQINPFELKPQERGVIQFEMSKPQSVDEVATIEAVLKRIYPKLKSDWRNDDDWAFHLATSEMEDMRWGILLERYWGLSDDRLAYRQRIRQSVRGMRRQMENGHDLCSILESAVALGALICEARLHDELARYTRIGKHVRDGGRKGAQSHGRTPAEEKYPRYRKSFEQFRAKGLSKVAAYKAAANEHRTSDRTVRKAVTGN